MTAALLGLYGASEQVEITSDRFEADEVKLVTKFIGHVHMKKGRDELNASKVIVYFDKKRKPKRYEAIGNASFVILMKKEGQLYTGKADRLVYLPARQRYELYGDVVLKEPRLDRTVRGEKVVVEKLSGKASVEGNGKRPVKFIFKVEENNASQDR
jgi:lipopolysaccharide export system protein LptA